MPAKKNPQPLWSVEGPPSFFFFLFLFGLDMFFLFLNTGSFPSNVITRDGVLGQDCYGSIALTESWYKQGPTLYSLYTT